MSRAVKRTEIARKSSVKRKRSTSAAKKVSAKTARNKADEAWSKYVRARDNYTCQYCGRSGDHVNAHHVMIREFSATRCDPDNGVTVCGMPCHTRVMHGQPDKAEAFYYRHLGPELLGHIRRKGYEGVGAKYGAPFWQEQREHLQKLLEAL